MILTSETRSKAFVAAGLWGEDTLDAAFRRHAAERPDDLAIADGDTGPVPGAAASYSYAEANRRVEGLAAFLAGLGLKPDTVLGIHLPNVAEAQIVVLAALRAGLVIVPLPLHWTDREITRAVEQAGIRAIVTASRVERAVTGERIRDIAAEAFSIRFVLGFGDGLADGLIDLAEVMAELDALGPAPELTRRGNPADHVAMVSFSRRDGRLVAVPLTHNHLLAIGRFHAEAAGVGPGARIASAMMPAGLSGLGAGLATAIAAGAGLVALHGTGARQIAGAVRTQGAAHLVVPAPLGPILAGDLTGHGVTLSLVSPRSSADPVAPTGFADDDVVVDVATFGGITLLPVRRVGGQRPPGPWLRRRVARCPSRSGSGRG
ncbi:class I adenylate-forming enzyme family protein, partial [Methylobrevis pamukkalensis]|uniref:class I adenylate-forming enzyme family protein n=1 Tax=Methylobrevis pamukkalensis TaxID=1439726 RepID=UPI00114CAB22